VQTWARFHGWWATHPACRKAKGPQRVPAGLLLESNLPNASCAAEDAQARAALDGSDMAGERIGTRANSDKVSEL